MSTDSDADAGTGIDTALNWYPTLNPESDSLMRAGEMSSDGFPSGADPILARDKRQQEALLNTYMIHT